MKLEDAQVAYGDGSDRFSGGGLIEAGEVLAKEVLRYQAREPLVQEVIRLTNEFASNPRPQDLLVACLKLAEWKP